MARLTALANAFGDKVLARRQLESDTLSKIYSWNERRKSERALYR